MPRRALGIPDRDRYVELPTISDPVDWKFSVQDHRARRAGKHLDLRLLPGGGDAHSWAIRHWPRPGETRLAMQQPTHQENYATWSGTLSRGYGAGEVRLKDHGGVRVISSGPDHIRFVRFQGKNAEEFFLRRISDKRWIIRNVSTTPDKYKFPQDKPSYKEVPFAAALEQEGVMSPKVSGAQGLVVLEEGKFPRVFSVRRPIHGGVIEWTHKMPYLYKHRVPRGTNAVLRAEVYLESPDGRALAEQQTAGVLNSGVEKAMDTMRGLGAELRVMPFSVIGGESPYGAPYESQLSQLSTLSQQMPFLKMPELARTLEQRSALVKRIGAKQHPLSTEGVVIWGQRPVKAKITKDYDIFPTRVFPGEGKHVGRAGGFHYAREPGGPEVGKVGTGLSDALREELWANRERLRGRVARIVGNKEMPSGALYAPRFTGWHPDKDPGEWPETMEQRPVRNPTNFKVGFLKKMAELGLLPSDFERVMHKESGIGSALKGVATAVMGTAPRALAFGLGVPLVGGALAGGVARSATQADDETLDEVKDQEMTTLYRRLARDVRERTQRERERRIR